GVAVAVALGRPQWVALATTLGVGTSIFMVRAINVEAYQDNVLALATLAASITPVLLSLQDRRAMLPGVLLLGATGLLHWNVLEVAVGMIALTALAYLPSSLRAWRSGTRLWDSPTGRLLALDAAGAAVAAGAILGALTAPLPTPR